MNESVSYTYLLNIIILFIFVAFAVLVGTLSYTKAFRVNSKIADAIEKCEGYNNCSQPEITRIVTNFGYVMSNTSCPIMKGASKNGQAINLSTGGKVYGYCIYEFQNDGDVKHYSYGILTYMTLDMPVVVDVLKLRVYSKTDRIYNFAS